MKIEITTKNFKLTESIEGFIEGKFERISRKIDTNTIIHVTLSNSKKGQKVEAMLNVGGQLLKLEAIDSDLYVSIDKLTTKLNYQVAKLMDKSQERKGDSIRYLKDKIKGDESENMEEKLPIVKRKYFDMKPMMEEEALLQMKMLNHSFFFFFNGETETMCLLYKRKDGKYGLIEGVN